MNKQELSYILISIFFYCASLNAQTFSAVNSTFRTQGMLDWTQGETILYGSGLIFLDDKGEVKDQLRLVEGLESSDFIDGRLAQNGDAYLLSKKELSLLSTDKIASSIFKLDDHVEDTSNDQFIECKIDNSGNVFILSRYTLFKLALDKTVTILGQPQEENERFKELSLGKNGEVLALSHNKLYRFNEGKNEVVLLNARLNVQDFFYTSDDQIIILDYRNIFTIKDNELVYFLKGKQLASGIKFYEAIFNSSTDYWLYCNEGNAFHNKDGLWNNYTPPSGLKTGNYGESMYQSRNGDIWMGLAGKTILHYNGSKWSQLDIDIQESIPRIGNARLVGGDQLISHHVDNENHIYFIENEMSEVAGLPDVRCIDLKKQDGVFYYIIKDGLYKVENGMPSSLVQCNDIKSVGVVGDQVFYNHNEKIFQLKNNDPVALENNQHYLGWDRVRAKFYQTHDQELLAYNTQRAGLLSRFDGKEWHKIISADGKRIGRVKNIIRYKDQTYVINESGGVMSYAGGNLSYILEQLDSSNTRLVHSYPAIDQSLWIKDGDHRVHYFKGEIYKSFKLPINAITPVITAIVPLAEEGKYYIHTTKEVLLCNVLGQE